ncbi:hypothetical protein POJ06DRAFT_251325 [Lipomyces tetrasporus]|uniref:Secreted protein n=1 Tax=Lipomyces tetrasporus TaxID=54092 RepID=A0AAD7QU68_9ASCO|nr:uncharacterized protein POJ06DRAFT_251325 [Lipomyces tetrasporus]KAJ8101373.1 hypothetical protein POJ06DRAFT_251325 [Lipomyces tetrasporus]
MLARLTLSQASLFTAWAWISSSACRLIRCNPTVDWRARASEFTDMVNRIVAQQRPSNWAMYQLVTTTLKILPHDECRSGDVCRVGHLRTCYLVGDPMSVSSNSRCRRARALINDQPTAFTFSPFPRSTTSYKCPTTHLSTILALCRTCPPLSGPRVSIQDP